MVKVIIEISMTGEISDLLDNGLPKPDRISPNGNIVYCVDHSKLTPNVGFELMESVGSIIVVKNVFQPVDKTLDFYSKSSSDFDADEHERKAEIAQEAAMEKRLDGYHEQHPDQYTTPEGYDL